MGGIVKKLIDPYDVHYTKTTIYTFFRQGQFLNVRSEKTSENAFYNALTDAASKWTGAKVKDYCCVESLLLEKDQGRYMTHYFYAYNMYQ